MNELIKVTLWGESHQSSIGATIENLAPGIKIDLDFIRSQLKKRQADGRISTSRVENDDFEIVSGLFNGYTTGTPLTIIIKNQNVSSTNYEENKYNLRPSQADFTSYEKYLGYQDYRGSGHFSGRITAPLVAIGAIAIQILKSKGIMIGTHVIKLKDINDDSLLNYSGDLIPLIESMNNQSFPVLDQVIKEKMVNEILSVKNDCDSCGATLESVVYGLPSGIGEPFFNSIESRISASLFSIPAIKGVEFGLGFAFSSYNGCQVNDQFINDDGIKTKTNNNGGINGGISNGMPIILKTVVKPTPSIGKVQKTINYKTKEEVDLAIKGRHDPCIASRIAVIIDSMIALSLLDLLAMRYGYMYMR